jgi:threonine dehydratase
MPSPTDLTFKDIYIARQRIASVTRTTPLIEDMLLSRYLNGKVFLKLENTQLTGSFKLRGAANKILSLSKVGRQKGVITVSSGNHGRAVAYVSREIGLPAIVCISEPVPANKREAIRSLGAELIVGGADGDQAMEFADEYQLEHGLTMVHPFDDPLIIAGQGTSGLEIVEEVPEVDTVVVPLSGGGLCAGVALALKSADPEIRVIGVSMELGPAMVESLRAGRIVEITESPTLADALAGGLNKDNKYTFRMIQKYVDETVLVSEDEIATAMSYLLEKHHLVVEGGGAVGVAALLFSKVHDFGKNIAVLISGGNVDIGRLTRITQEFRNYQVSD